MTARPFYAVDEPQDDPKAIALVLHGGRATSTSAVRARQLAVVRMTPFAASLRRAGRSRGLAVARMRYLVRGWNGDRQSPVADVRWVLDRLAERYPGLPIALVGHSMGGRAAVHAAPHPAVATVVGLAPWIESDDPHGGVEGRDVLVVHGEDDRVTSPRASAEWTRRAATVTDAAYVLIRDDGHAMLRRAGTWHGLATGFVLASLRATPPEETTSGIATGGLSKILAGEASLVV